MGVVVKGLGPRGQTVRTSKMFHLGRDKPIKTWNPVGGCQHHCYGDGCWAARQAPRIPRYDGGFDHPKLFGHELKKRFGDGVVVFVTSMGDLFGSWVPDYWIIEVIHAMERSPNATFFLETKNPARYRGFLEMFRMTSPNTILSTTIETNRDYLRLLPPNTITSTTIETNRDYRVSMAPPVWGRFEAFRKLMWPHKHVSIEPIMDFDLEVLVEWMHGINPDMVSVGYDNWNCNLPEPPLDKTMALIDHLERFTKVERKTLREADK